MAVLEQPIPLAPARREASEDLSGLIKAFVIGFVIAALIFGLVGGVVIWRMAVMLNTANTELAAAQAELETVSTQSGADYYRGLYDFCVFVAGNMFSTAADDARSQCTTFAVKAEASNWYGEQSTGWSWPLAQGEK